MHAVPTVHVTAANGASANYALSSAVVASSDRGGNFKVLMPAKVYAGSAASLTASWSGLAAGKRFVGAVPLKDPNGAPAAPTVFQVETNNPLPLGEPADRDAVVGLDSGI